MDTNMDTIKLPVIDISNPNDPAVGKAMLDAAANYGFLYVNSKGSDFTTEDVNRGFGLVRTPDISPGPPRFDSSFIIVGGVLCLARARKGNMPHPAECT
jgi:hypothetical protein